MTLNKKDKSIKEKDKVKTKDKEKKKNKKEKKTKDKTKKFSKIKEKLKKINIFAKEDDNNYTFKEVVIITIFSLGLGFFTCFSFVKIFNNGRSVFFSDDLDKIADTYYAIVDNYYGDLDKDELIDSAINGMVSSVGDYYTSYSDSDSTSEFLETVDGTYEGIGCTVGMNADEQIVVVEVFMDGPADKAGLKVGDIITKVDGEDYTDKTSTDVSEYVKNSKNSEIKMTVKRENEEKEINITRSKVEVPSVFSKTFEQNNKKVGYLQISIFSSVTANQFKDKLETLEKENIDSLIIDVRNNGGGYLSTVTDIANMLLKKGDIIYQLEGSSGTKEKKATNKNGKDYPIAILTNGNSASASEILASAIKESYGGYVVGTNTYGKGTVQQTMDLGDGSMIKYTVQKWLTPDGNWINETGVEPTNYVELNESYYDNPTDENDNQLQTAIDLVTK